jgi:hypothetical protein
MYSATIQWGDGSSSTGNIVANGNGGYNVIGTHTYTKAGDYSVVVSINDAGTVTTVTSMARLVESHITARGLTAIGTATMDVNYTIAAFRDSDRDATAAQFTASIDWADGSTSAGTVEADGSGGFRVSGHHRYATTGLRSVKITISDTSGRSATATGTARVMGMM